MKKIVRVIYLLKLCILSTLISAQSSTKTIELKKGEVLDVLHLSQNPDTDEALKSYFKNVIPIGNKLTYQSLAGFKVVGHQQGNHRPQIIAFGKWSSLSKREAFGGQILTEIPDFHALRRSIWSYFGTSYYEMQQDLTVSFVQEKYHAVTSIWLKTAEGSSTYLQKWQTAVANMGGDILMDMQNANSPFGYIHKPHYFAISSWKNEAAYIAFRDKVREFEMNEIQHINEVIIQ